jgi:hypothetical protein
MSAFCARKEGDGIHEIGSSRNLPVICDSGRLRPIPIRRDEKTIDQSAIRTTIADLKAGRGMGLALPAELNGYLGPIHVLELSDKLGLSAEQKSRIEARSCWRKKRN